MFNPVTDVAFLKNFFARLCQEKNWVEVLIGQGEKKIFQRWRIDRFLNLDDKTVTISVLPFNDDSISVKGGVFGLLIDRGEKYLFKGRYEHRSSGWCLSIQIPIYQLQRRRYFRVFLPQQERFIVDIYYNRDGSDRLNAFHLKGRLKNLSASGALIELDKLDHSLKKGLTCEILFHFGDLNDQRIRARVCRLEPKCLGLGVEWLKEDPGQEQNLIGLTLSLFRELYGSR